MARRANSSRNRELQPSPGRHFSGYLQRRARLRATAAPNRRLNFRRPV